MVSQRNNYKLGNSATSYLSYTQPVTRSPKSVNLLSSFKSFSKTFIIKLTPLITSNPKNTSQVHPSYSNLFISTASGGVAINSTQRVLKLIYDYCFFTYKLEYYSVASLYFSNPFFKYEVTYLNRHSSTKYNLFIGSLKSFFFKKKTNKIYNYQIFNLLKGGGYNVSMIFDAVYHQKTVSSLHKLGFFLLGPVPTYMPKYTLNVALPTTNDSFTSQLLLIRSLFFIRKKVSHQRLKNTYY